MAPATQAIPDAVEKTIAPAAIECALAIYQQLQPRDQSVVVQARKILTQHIFGMVDQGERDEQRLTVGGLVHLHCPKGNVTGSIRDRLDDEADSDLDRGRPESELSRWADETPVTFLLPLKEQEFRFYRYRPAENLLVLEINEFPETAPVVLPGGYLTRIQLELTMR